MLSNTALNMSAMCGIRGVGSTFTGGHPLAEGHVSFVPQGDVPTFL
jgi:hypothetical protein